MSVLVGSVLLGGYMKTRHVVNFVLGQHKLITSRHVDHMVFTEVSPVQNSIFQLF